MKIRLPFGLSVCLFTALSARAPIGGRLHKEPGCRTVLWNDFKAAL